MAKPSAPPDKSKAPQRTKIPPGQLKHSRNPNKQYKLDNLVEGYEDMEGHTYRVLYDPDGYVVVKAGADY
jgi:hypothetical protein